MSPHIRRARLQLTRLDDRVLPSTVTATTAARSLDFTGTGTVLTTGIETTTNTVTVSGIVNYTDEASGESSLVTITGSGTGEKVQAPPTGGTFAQTIMGKLTFADDDGSVTTIDPLTATQTRLVPAGENEVALYGPVDAAGTFDVSNFKLVLDWGTTGDDAHTGNLTVTLADKNTTDTDLAFDSKSASRNAAGNIDLDFAVAVSGRLANAPSHTAEIAKVTAVWEGGGKSEAVELEVPVFWNTGTITIEADDLAAPEWAETLTVHLDAADQLAERDETNNTWTVTLADLTLPNDGPPVEQPPVVQPPVEQPPVVAPPAEQPVVVVPPIDPVPVLAGFSLTTGPSPFVEWRDAEGRVFGTIQAVDGFTGPVAIAAGDVNGDGVMDAVIGAGQGGGPRVRVFDGKTGNVHHDFFAYDTSFRGGVTVALADLNRDGYSEIIAGAGDGGGPHVRVFDGQSGRLINQFFAYDPDFRGGVRVAAGDLNGDGVAEIITGTGPGGGPVLAVFDATTGTEKLRLLAGGDGDRAGVTVRATTDTTGLVLVTADPEGNGPARRFRNQMKPTEALLVPLVDPIIPPVSVFLN